MSSFSFLFFLWFEFVEVSYLFCVQQEGFLEIREDYVDESSARESESGRFLPLVIMLVTWY